MPILHFITHPEVVIDPSVPVPDWPLAPEGIRRMCLTLEQPWMSQLGSVFSSAERKTRDAAGLVADRFGLSPVILAELGENDRSATGYLPKAEFEEIANLFFAHPERSVRGWERAVDAQRRISVAVERVIAATPRDGDIAVISHGGVGALLPAISRTCRSAGPRTSLVREEGASTPSIWRAAPYSLAGA